MGIIELFNDFMSLEYIRRTRPDNYFSDYSLGGNRILRQLTDGDHVYYLSDGGSLFIPWPWIDLFYNLYLHSGDQILSIDCSPHNILAYFIQLFVKLQSLIISHKNIDGDKFLDVLSDISIIGTKRFRDYMNREYSIVLPELSYNSPTKNFNI